MSDLYLSIDIGGTKIRAIEYHKNFLIKKVLNFKTSNFFKEKIKQNFNNLLTYLSSLFKEKYVVLGLSINSLVKNNIVEYWSLVGGITNINLKSECSKYFYFKKFISDNDVICAAKAEVKFGLGKKYKNFAFLNLGTGVRIVNVENKIILRGFQNLAGEISVLPIYNQTIKKIISLEEIIGGRYLEKNYLSKKKNLKKYISDLNYLFQLITVFYNPEIIVIDGGVVNHLKKFLKEINLNYLKTLPRFFLSKKIVLSKLKYPSSLGAVTNY